ncbi:hypothetical protein CERSUDRAFT_116663 [Gelatoporia subvermispora B]|uniref:Multiple RNA-binding domain-containing protein 1 n=1 Tax=Ceriporiopsis subvermispora (strain B) TaxID=914234 RepID=M2QT28_CERS8|nr:hypothetical protein CERSUDRAFT_116663 [Gelatoporia subvermispora B]
MSRLIVKNLPSYLTQQGLRAHFESKDGPGGTLTDVKVVLRPDGTSRRFGFLGYKTPAEAERAKKWYNRTFVDGSRISVEVIEGVKDAPPPRPNKRPRLDASGGDSTPGRSSQDRTHELKEVKSPKANALADEFLRTMQPRTKGPSWADGDLSSQPIASTSTGTSSSASMKSKKDRSKSKDAPDQHHAEPQPDAEAASDLDWLKRHTRSTLDPDASAADKVFNQSDDEADAATEGSHADDTDKVAVTEDPLKVTILETGRLFLRNLSYTCTDEELKQLFSPYGEIAQVHIPVDPLTKQPKGLAYVTFAQPSSAVAAFEALDKASFQGRLLHVLPAVDRRGKEKEGEGAGDAGRKKTLKEERDAKRKASAGREFNWAMLYMNSDAVVSSVADRLHISKSEILDPTSDNAAVKLALAETHIIQETKTFLEENGVVMSSLSPGQPIKRSDTIILVKNIPYGTSAEALRSLFEPHGTLRRVLIPPAGTLAVVEFEHADDGKRAFKALAYRRLGNAVMYLEKGPMGMFAEGSAAPSAGGDPAIKSAASKAEPVKLPDQIAAAADEDRATEDEPPLSSGSTLFVKNLSFATTSAGLSAIARHLPGFAFARVQMKPSPNEPGERLSMGYGFVGFKTKDDAKRGAKALEGTVLDGHALSVKWAGRGTEDDAKAEDAVKAKGTKMIVKNVPFEATKKDIRELFSAHAQLKSVRLPRKFDHRARGFAFLEFTTHAEAARAYATLRHTHLLGRHLVLEWAEDTQDIDALRQKAGVGYGGGKEVPGRKRKLEMGDDGEEEE